MKSFLNKSLFGAGAFITLTYALAEAQPIQLLPHKTDSPAIPMSLSFPQEAKGFWERTPPSLIEAYFPKIPLRLTSSLLRTLRADVIKEKYGPLLNNVAYEQALLALLIEIGQFTEAKDFLENSTVSEKETFLLDIQWLEGEQKKACEKITHLIRISSSPDWKTQNIYCLFLNGERERGKIAAELLSESNPKAFPLMNSLFDPSSKPSFEPSIAASPFLLTVWAATGQELTEEALKQLSPSHLALIARTEKIPLKTRILAASLAFQEGSFTQESLLTLLKDAPSDELLGSLAKALQSPKPEILLPLLEKAMQEHKLGFVGFIFKPFLSKIEPSQETLILSPYMVRTYLEVGEKDLAQKWGTFFMREAPDEAPQILPHLHLAYPQIKWGEAQLQAWQVYQSRLHPQNVAQNSYELREILSALGENPGLALKSEPVKLSWRQEKGLFDEKTLELLDSAVLSQRKGEILLLILVLIGETPIADIPSDKFVRLLSALYKGGYADQARILALEYLLTRGI